MNIDNIDSDCIIYCILKHIKFKNEKEDKIFKILERNLPKCKSEIEEAEGYCIKRGWLYVVHNVERRKYDIKSYDTIEANFTGRESVQTLWSSSGYNFWRWKSNILPLVISVCVYSIYIYFLIKCLCHVRF